jgi:hypothetical protein
VPAEDQGANPILEVSPQSINVPAGGIARHIFYLFPDFSAKAMRLRVADSAQALQAIYNQLGLDWNARASILMPLSRGASEGGGESARGGGSAEGGPQYLLETQRDGNKRFYRASLGENMRLALSPIDTSVDLGEVRTNALVQVRGREFRHDGGTVAGWFQSPFQADLGILGGSAFRALPALAFRPDERNPLTALLAAFDFGARRVFFAQTKKDLISYTDDGRALAVAKYPLYASQYLPIEYYAQAYRPVAVDLGGRERAPGFFVDAAFRDIGTAYVVLQGRSGLVAPVDLNLKPPPGCVFLGPSTSDGQELLAYACRSTAQELALNFLPLRL